MREPAQLLKKICEESMEKARFYRTLHVFSFIQLLDIDKKMLSQKVADLEKNMSEAEFRKLLSFVTLTRDEINSVRVNKREKSISIVSLLQAIYLSMLGIGSSILSFLSPWGLFIEILNISLTVITFLVIIYLSKITWDLLKNEEKDCLSEIKIKKIRLRIMQIVNYKITHNITSKINEIGENLLQMQLIDREEYDKLMKDFMKYNLHGISNTFFQLAQLIRKNNSHKSTHVDQLADGIAHFASRCKPAIEMLGQNSAFILQPHDEQMTDAVFIEENAVSRQPLTIKEWFRRDKKTIIKSGLTMFIGNTAANLGLPGTFIVLKKAIVENILQVVGVSLGVGLFIGLALSMSVIYTGWLLYNDYKKKCRKDQIQKIKNDVTYRKKIVHINRDKQEVLLELIRLCYKCKGEMNAKIAEEKIGMLEKTAMFNRDPQFSEEIDHELWLERLESPVLSSDRKRDRKTTGSPNAEEEEFFTPRGSLSDTSSKASRSDLLNEANYPKKSKMSRQELQPEMTRVTGIEASLKLWFCCSFSTVSTRPPPNYELVRREEEIPLSSP